MRAANRIAALEGLLNRGAEDRLNAFVASFGLPTAATFDPASVREKMKADKKNTADTQTWVLAVTAGGVVLHRGVSDANIDAALESIRSN
jgi:3-dehydroquinate synthetase